MPNPGSGFYTAALDIETVRDDDAVELILAEPPEFSAPGNYKDEEKIAAYLVAEEEKWIETTKRKAALSARTGRVASWGLVPIDESLQPRSAADCIDDATDGPLLEALTAALASTRVLVTFNGLDFDAPFLRTRYLRNRLLIPNHVLKPGSRYRTEPFCDVRMVLADWDRHAVGSLRAWSRFLGLDDPGQTDPNDVQNMFECRDVDGLANHALVGATACAKLYNRLCASGILP